MSDESDLDDLLNKGSADDDFGEYGGFSEDKPMADKPISAGDHPAEVESAKMVPASDGQRAYGAISNLEIRWRIIGGSDTKRVIYERIPLKHTNAENVARARSTMGEIRLAMGLEAIPNASFLQGRKCLLKVAHSVPKKAGDPVYANVRGHKPIPEGMVAEGATADEVPF
jgi:hypothetical protein